MLVELEIHNMAIIASQHLSLGPGFSVLTGETGAGKSMVVDAVALLLGSRASSDVIRTGCEQATIEGVFSLSPAIASVLAPLLQPLDLEIENNEIALRRDISQQRRNACRVNGYTTALSTLEEIGSHLVDLHGQGAHLSLLQPRNHVRFVDRYGGLDAQREAFADGLRALRRVRQDLLALRRDERELARRADLLAYQIKEIRAARLSEGEEEDLREQAKLLGNAEKRMDLAAQVYGALVEGERRGASVVDALSDAIESITELATLDSSVAETAERLSEALYAIEDATRAVRHYREGIEFDPEALAQALERLDVLRGLKRKYGDSVGDILVFAQRAESELDGIAHSHDRELALEEEARELNVQLGSLGEALSIARRETARRLEEAMSSELDELGMASARFSVSMTRHEDKEGVPVDGIAYAADETGLDHVEFMIAPNLGEDLRPLARIASGGETSRLMLAIKTCLSAIDPVPTLIFDEIDAGIGGRAGRIVGKKLQRLADRHQVLCVTHLPQIAACARQHFRVAKRIASGRTQSVAEMLSHDDRIGELAVMLGGADTESARRSAAELLAASLSPSEDQPN